MIRRTPVLFFLIVIVLLNQLLYSQTKIQGTVIDNGAEHLGRGAEPVAGALVTITDQADSNRTFSGYTDDRGRYAIEITPTAVREDALLNPGTFRLLQNYPNPFNPSTVIRYEVVQPTRLSIEIYNVLGQKIKTLLSGVQRNSGRVIWHGTDDRGRGVPAGCYIYSMRASGKRVNRKMLLIDGGKSASSAVLTSSARDPVEKTILHKPLTGRYTLTINRDGIAPYQQRDVEISGDSTVDVMVYRTLTDIDGNVYRLVKIRDRWWMAENYRVSRYRNGDTIAGVTDKTAWSNLSSAARCVYDNTAANADFYGLIYNGYAVHDNRNIAPKGWHVPTDEEWKALEMQLGMSQSEADDSGWRGTGQGGMLKQTGTTHWSSPNTGAINATGFTALPGGFRNAGGDFDDLYDYSGFWTATESSGNSGWYRGLSYDSSTIHRQQRNMQEGFYVRLVCDSVKTVEIVKLEVCPKNPVVNAGDTLQFTCTTIFWDSSRDDATLDATWSLSPGTAGSIDSKGRFIAGSADAGSERLTVSYKGYSDDATITIRTTLPQTGSMTGNDGKTYHTVKIGEQWWMAENLRETQYRDGTVIPNVTDNSEWDTWNSPAWRVFDDDESNADTYGYLYNWFAVVDTQNIAPKGWHVSTDADWKALERYLGMGETDVEDTGWRGTAEGGKLKAAGTTYWLIFNIGATNESGFTALPAGLCDYDGLFTEKGSYAYFWTASEYGLSSAWCRSLFSYLSSIKRSHRNKNNGFAVRLVRD